MFQEILHSQELSAVLLGIVIGFGCVIIPYFATVLKGKKRKRGIHSPKDTLHTNADLFQSSEDHISSKNFKQGD